MDEQQKTPESKFKENEDYVFVPIADDADAWGVRFTKGPYIETVIKFGAISFNDVAGHLRFNFSIISSPDEDLSIQNEEFQIFVAQILESIIEYGIMDGTVQFEDK